MPFTQNKCEALRSRCSLPKIPYKLLDHLARPERHPSHLGISSRVSNSDTFVAHCDTSSSILSCAASAVKITSMRKDRMVK